MVLGATGGAMPFGAEGSLWRWFAGLNYGLGPGACDPPGRFVQAFIGIASPTFSCCRDTWECAGMYGH